MKHIPDLILIAVLAFLLSSLLYIWDKELDRFDADRQHFNTRSTDADSDCRKPSHTQTGEQK